MRTWLPTCFFVIALVTLFSVDLASSLAAPPRDNALPLRCALIDVDQSPLAGLVEAELIVRPSEEWLERTEINRLLQERQLQSLLSANAGNDRVALGQTLKADVLILLRTTQQDQETAVELVVAETNQGLRLLTTEFRLEGNLEEHAAALVILIDQAIAKARQEIRHVFAVPPFVSDDLTFEYDYLKAAYAKLLEHSLLDLPGVLTVELEEARAIANERMLTAEGGSIKRQLPIYLLGQFRNEGKDDQREVQITLSIQQGAKELDKQEAKLSPSDVVVFLRDRAQAVAKTQGIDAVKVDPAIEAQQLNQRAQQFTKLGNWDEALGLVEASLMLHPDQAEQHSEAIELAKRQASTYSPHKLDEIAKASELTRRSLGHLQILAAKFPLEHCRRHFDVLRFAQGHYLVDHDASSPLLKQQIELEEGYRKEKHQLAMELVHRFAEEGDWDASSYVAMHIVRVMVPEQGYAERTKLILRYQDRPDVNKMVHAYAHRGSVVANLRSLEGRRFLQQLAVHPDANDQVKQAATEMLDAIGTLPEKETYQTSGDPNNETGLTFLPVKLTYQAKNGNTAKLNWMDGCLPLDGGIDVFYSRAGLFLLSESKQLRQLWQAPNSTTINSIVYDGKYVWLAASVHQQAAQVWVFDPVTAKGTQLTAAEGLPLLSPDQIPGANYVVPSVSVATIEPGRAILAGDIERTWLADVRFDPTGDHQVNIFHEAKEIVVFDPNNPNKGEEDPQNINVAFRPTGMTTLSTRMQSGERKQMVMIGRHCPGYYYSDRPLLVDPDDLSIRVSGHKTPSGVGGVDSKSMQDGANYFAGVSAPHFNSVALVRIGYPDFAPQVAMPGVREGHLFFNQSGEVNIVGMDWQRGRVDDGKLESFGPVPWLYTNRYAASEKSPPARFERGSFQLNTLADSNHFGSIMSCSEIDGPGGIVQILFDGSGLTLKEALNGVPAEKAQPTKPKAIVQAPPVEDRNLWERPPRCLGIAYSPNGDLIVTASRNAVEAVQVWDGKDGQLVANLLNDPLGMTAVTFSHDGKSFATGGTRGRVVVWDTKTLQPLVECQGQTESIGAMAFSWNDKLLTAASKDRTASTWSLPDGKHLHAIEKKNVGIQWVGFSADDSLLLTTSHHSGYAFNAKDGKEIGPIESVKRAGGFLDDRTLIANSADEDNTLIQWNSTQATAKPLWPGMVGDPVAVSPDGRLLATFHRDFFVDNERKELYRVEIWDLPSKTRLCSVDGNIAGHSVFTPQQDALLVLNAHGGLRRIDIPRREDTLQPMGLPVTALRTWTDSTGKHQREGIFQRVQGGHVLLLGPEGQSLNVPLDRLSPEDQKYVREQTQR